jgi:competence protein ComEA
MNLRLPAVAAVIVVAAGAAAYRAFHREPAPPIASLAAGSSIVGVPSGTAGASSAVLQPPQPRRTDARVTVYVAGAVVHAGVYALPATARGVDALHAAGGARGDADLVAVNLAQRLEDGEEIVVPVVGADPAAASAAGSVRRSRRARADGEAEPVRKAHRKRARKHRKPRAATVDASYGDASGASDASDASAASAVAADPPTETVDLNTADENELETLPGIGASLAARIVEFREINGPFASPDDLLDVGGMTQGRLDAIEPYVTTR